MLVTLLLAGFGSYYASSSPDGLARVSIDKGLDKGERDHALGDSWLAGYSVQGVGDDRLSGGLAGVAGVCLTFLVVGGVTMALRRRGPDARPGKGPADPSPRGGGAQS